MPHPLKRSVQIVATQLTRAAGIKQAHFDAVGVFREHGKVHAVITGMSAQGIDAAWAHGKGQVGQHGTRYNVARGGR